METKVRISRSTYFALGYFERLKYFSELAQFPVQDYIIEWDTLNSDDEYLMVFVYKEVQGLEVE